MTERRSIIRRRPPPRQAPARYPGQAGALRRDPIPRWRYDDIAEPLADEARMAERERELTEARMREFRPYPVGPGGVTGEPPPTPAETVSLSANQGSYPADGSLDDWLRGGPPHTPPRGALFVGNQAPVDPEPWRQPAGTDRFGAGLPSPRTTGAPLGVEGGTVNIPTRMERGALDRAPTVPRHFPALPQQNDEIDLDAEWRAALARAQGAIQKIEGDPTGLRTIGQAELGRIRQREAEEQLRRRLPLLR